MFKKLAFSLALLMSVLSVAGAYAETGPSAINRGYSFRVAQNDDEAKRIEREKLKDEMLLESALYKPAGAWALSFFIGLFTPFLGAGQYYAKSYATAVPTMLVGFGSWGCFIAGAVKKDKTLMWAGWGVFAGAWLFDWIYAIVATNKLNDKIRAKFKAGNEPAFDVRPLVSYGYMPEGRDHVFNLGLSMRF
jgi:hypothetical protein